MKSLFLVLMLAGLVSACGSLTNTAYLDGAHEFGRADFKLHPVRVLAIDGDYTIDVNPVRAEPGLRKVRVEAAPVAGFREPTVKDVELSIAPCTRYYLAARRENPLMQDFQLVVQFTESIPDCMIAKNP